MCYSMDMKQRHVHLKMEPKQYDAIEKLSKKTGAPVSELIRRAVDMYLEAEAKGKKA